MDLYRIWRIQFGWDYWVETAHTANARSDKEAQSRVARKFANAGFSSMSLLAVVDGANPNHH